MARSKNPTQGEELDQLARELAKVEGIPMAAARSRVRSEIAARKTPAERSAPTRRPPPPKREASTMTFNQWLAASNWPTDRPLVDAEAAWRRGDPPLANPNARAMNPIPLEPSAKGKAALAKMKPAEVKAAYAKATKDLKASKGRQRDLASKRVCYLLWEGARRKIPLDRTAEPIQAKAKPRSKNPATPPATGCSVRLPNACAAPAPRGENPTYHIPMIEDGMAKGYHVEAWARAEEEAGRTYPGEDLTKVAPPVTEAARAKAIELVKAIERENGRTIDDIFHEALAADKLSQDAADDWAEDFGFALALQSLHVGKRWDDSHASIQLEVPETEFHYLDPEEYGGERGENPVRRSKAACGCAHPVGGTAEERELARMLEARGYAPSEARRLASEGMGPEELRERLRVRAGAVGSLEHRHGIARRQNPHMGGLRLEYFPAQSAYAFTFGERPLRVHDGVDLYFGDRDEAERAARSAGLVVASDGSVDVADAGEPIDDSRYYEVRHANPADGTAIAEHLAQRGREDRKRNPSKTQEEHAYEALAPFVRVEKHLASLATGVERLPWKRKEKLEKARRRIATAHQALVTAYTRYLQHYETEMGARVKPSVGTDLGRIRGPRAPSTFEEARESAAELLEETSNLGLLPNARTSLVEEPLRKLIEVIADEEHHVFA